MSRSSPDESACTWWVLPLWWVLLHWVRSAARHVRLASAVWCTCALLCKHGVAQRAQRLPHGLRRGAPHTFTLVALAARQRRQPSGAMWVRTVSHAVHAVLLLCVMLHPPVWLAAAGRAGCRRQAGQAAARPAAARPAAARPAATRPAAAAACLQTTHSHISLPAAAAAGKPPGLVRLLHRHVSWCQLAEVPQDQSCLAALSSLSLSTNSSLGHGWQRMRPQQQLQMEHRQQQRELRQKRGQQGLRKGHLA